MSDDVLMIGFKLGLTGILTSVLIIGWKELATDAVSRIGTASATILAIAVLFAMWAK